MSEKPNIRYITACVHLSISLILLSGVSGIFMKQSTHIPAIIIHEKGNLVNIYWNFASFTSNLIQK